MRDARDDPAVIFIPARTVRLRRGVAEVIPPRAVPVVFFSVGAVASAVFSVDRPSSGRRPRHRHACTRCYRDGDDDDGRPRRGSSSSESLTPAAARSLLDHLIERGLSIDTKSYAADRRGIDRVAARGDA